MHSISSDHQECMGILPAHKNTQRVVAYTRTQKEMPIAVSPIEFLIYSFLKKFRSKPSKSQ